MRGWRVVRFVSYLAVAAILGVLAVRDEPTGGAASPGTGRGLYLRGLDVSRWNGRIRWPAVARAGYRFVYAKASEGGRLVDPLYARHRAGAARAGLLVGAYHFARPGGVTPREAARSARAQADHFLAVARPRPGDLRPALDLEQTGGLSPGLLVRWARAWLAAVAERIHVAPIVYASPQFWRRALHDTPALARAGYRTLWLAAYPPAERAVAPGLNWGGWGWTVWQWTSCARIPGVAQCADSDLLVPLGLIVLTIGAEPSAPPPPPTIPSPPPVQPAPVAPSAVAPPTIAGTARVGQSLAATEGSWTGTPPIAFTFQWELCPASGTGCAAIAGATARTYTPTADTVGGTLLVLVTAASSAGTGSAQSRATSPVTALEAAPSG